ncbi:MAG TPA: hypothetical protein VGB07_36790 [Blastocatellia bacterium]
MWQAKFRYSRERTLILPIPPERYMRQEDFVHEHLSGISILDWRAEFLRAVKPEQRYLNLSVHDEVQRLKLMSAAHKGHTLCLINTEYVLTRFSYEERQEFWRLLWGDFPHNEAILIYSALAVPMLLPFDLEQWKKTGRVLPPV